MKIPMALTALLLSLSTVTRAGDTKSGETTPEPLRLVWSYSMIDYPQWCGGLRLAGFNAVTAAPSSDSPWWKTGEFLAKLEPLLKEAGLTGIGVYPTIAWSSAHSAGFTPRTVTLKGTEEPHMPCPLSEDLWGCYLIPAMESLARASKDHPSLRGCVIDSEQYLGQEVSGPVNDIYCFCDRCFAGFCKENKISPPEIPPSERGKWITSQGHLAAYYLRLEERTILLASDLSSRLTAINPDFALNLYTLDQSWFYRGFLKGMGETSRAVNVLDMRTYEGFIPSRANEMEEMLGKLNPKAVWAPGFSTAMLTPRGLGINIRMMQAQNRPYWIWNPRVPFPDVILKELQPH